MSVCVGRREHSPPVWWICFIARGKGLVICRSPKRINTDINFLWFASSSGLSNRLDVCLSPCQLHRLWNPRMFWGWLASIKTNRRSHLNCLTHLMPEEVQFWSTYCIVGQQGCFDMKRCCFFFLFFVEHWFVRSLINYIKTARRDQHDKRKLYITGNV